MIQINPLKSYIDGGVRAALTTPPSASLVFDLPGKAIWVKGVKLKGIDHTYTFNHDNYITLTNTPDPNNPESEDIKIGVNITTLKNVIDTTYSGGTLALLQEGLNTEERTWQAKILHSYINDVLPITKNIQINGTNYAIYTTEDSLPQFFAPVSLGTTGQILACTSTGLSWVNQIQNTDYRVSQSTATNDSDYRIILKQGADNNPETNFVRFSEYLTFNPSTKTLKINNIKVVTATDIYVGSTAGLVPAATSAQQNYYLRGDGAWVNIATEMAAANTWRPIKVENTDALGSGTNTGTLSFIAGTGITLAWDATNKRIIITNSSPDVNHNTDETVRQVPKTDNVNRPLMMINGSTSAGEQINTSMFSTGIYANASTKMITANGFIKAGSSNSYVLLGDGNHKVLSDFSMSGHTHSSITIPICSSLNENLDVFRVEYVGGNNTVTTKPSGVDAFGVMRLRTAAGWYGQIMISANTAPGIYYRNANGLSSSVGWKKLLDSSNFGDYAADKSHTHPYLPLVGGTLTGNIILKGGTSTDMTYTGNIHPYIRFDNSNSDQNVSLIFTDYDAYRRPAGIKLVGNQGNEWFEAANIYANMFYGTLSGNATTATTLQTPRTIWSQSFDGTGNVDNTLRIRQTTGNYCEGIRIQTADSTWATIILGATADTGTNTNAWSIHRKDDNNFAIARNSSDGVNGLVMTSTGMGLGTTAPTQRLDVHGNIRATNSIIASSAFINTGDSTLKIYSGKTQDAVSDGHIGLQTSIDSTDGQTHSYPIEWSYRCVLALQPRGGSVYIGNMPNGSNSRKLNVNGDIGLFNVGSIRDLAIGGGIYWNPCVESTTDSSDVASITLVKSGIAGGTTLVLSQMNDANDTIQFQTSAASRLYHNSYPILTTQNTYVSNNKGYINGTEITQVNNADTIDNYHILNTSKQVYKYIYNVTNPAGTWILIKFPAWNANNEIITIDGYGNNHQAHCVVHCGSRYQGIWGYQSDYNGTVVDKIRQVESDSGKFAIIAKINGEITELKVNATISLEISTTTEDANAFVITSNFFSSGGVFHGNVDWDKIIGKPSSFTPSAHTHPYLPLSGGTLTGALTIDFNHSGGGITSSLLNVLFNGTHDYGIVAKFHSYGGDSPAIRFSHSSNKSEYNSQVNTNWSVGMRSNTYTDFAITQNRGTSGWGTVRFAINNSGNVGIGIDSASYKLHVAGDIYTTTGFKKNGSSDSYVLLGGGGHKLISDFATSGHNHDDRYVRAFGTSNDNIDSDWGQSFKTFDPIPSGTPPEQNPNISILNIGNNFNRRKQLAFIYNNDNIYYRRRVENGFTNWRKVCVLDGFNNLTISGSYYANSDIRYKSIQTYLLNKVNSIAELPIFTYYWKDNQHDDKLHIGSSAQAVNEIFPELVTYDEQRDFYNLDYATLGTIAGITACKELVTQKSELQQLKEKVKQLEDKLSKYENTL